MSLNQLTDAQLLLNTEKAVQSERDATTTVIRHFQEIYDRKLFLPEYTSMFEMLTKKYSYCAGSAQIRLNAMKLIKDVPSVENKIEKGELSLSAAASVQTFLQFEKKNSRNYSENAKIELVETCVGKSVRDLEQEFARRNPEIEKRESIRFTSEDRLRVSHTISLELEEKLKRIKEIWSHIDPTMSREDLLNRMAAIVLDKIDPVRKAGRAQNRQDRKAKAISLNADPDNSDAKADSGERKNQNSFHPPHEMKPRTRYIVAKETHKVQMANKNQGCEYVHRRTRRRCGSRFQLQRDHIAPFSHDGTNMSENLRLLCAQHNRWRSRPGNRIKPDLFQGKAHA